MGGPWKARGFDPVAWRPPTPRIDESSASAGEHPLHDHLTGIVVGYVASVLTSVAIMLTLLRYGYGW